MKTDIDFSKILQSLPSFDNKFTVSKDMYNDNTNGPYWSDGGSDAFDSWGYFRIKLSSGTYALTLDKLNTTDGLMNLKHFTVGSDEFDLLYGWLVNGVFLFLVLNATSEFSILFRGNMGSDGSTNHGVYGNTYWSNDAGSINDTSGDPRITRTWFSDDSNTLTQFSWSGDNETSETGKAKNYGFLFINWGQNTVAEMYDWVNKCYESIMIEINQRVIIQDKDTLKSRVGGGGLDHHLTPTHHSGRSGE